MWLGRERLDKRGKSKGCRGSRQKGRPGGLNLGPMVMGFWSGSEFCVMDGGRSRGCILTER